MHIIPFYKDYKWKEFKYYIKLVVKALPILLLPVDLHILTLKAFFFATFCLLLDN